MLLTMPVTVRSFAKINLGLCIGPNRPDGFHELHTVYQTVALHDVIRVELARGSGVEIRCADRRVPTDESNTCYRIVEHAMAGLKAKGRVILEIEKRLPVQGGMGGASGNAVAALLGVELALKKQLPAAERLRIAAQVGSDVPLFLVGGTVLGMGRGEDVYPLADLPATPCVIATPEIGVSTPKAFGDWDSLVAQAEKPAKLGSAWTDEGVGPYVSGATGVTAGRDRTRPGRTPPKLTQPDPSDRMKEFSRKISAWLSNVSRKKTSGGRLSGVPAGGRGRAETLLLDLVRTGIENDFEQVVFPQYPALRDVKCALEQAGAVYASLSGSGSALYGLFKTRAGAEKAAARLRREGIPAQATVTLTRQQYWKRLQVSDF
ncbi:MAG: 4-(cytidine 5'-diphospho)-2-C-methyl-D-erythritol kinase [Terriglobales bacterium]